MKMQLFETLRLKFEQPNWALNPEFGLLDTILDQNPSLLTIVSSDILAGTKQSDFGRQDMPSANSKGGHLQRDEKVGL
jgi:IS5 family transposase